MTNNDLQLGALDFCFADGRTNAGDALWDTIALAPQLESFGYKRFWMTEHHTNLVAHSCPEILTGILAGLTKKMRVGPAGVLLRYYSPFKVAGTFRLIHALYPGRIDLGLARGYVDPVVSRLLDGLDCERSPDIYESKVSDLLAFLRGTGTVVPAPVGIAPPETWMLGSGGQTSKMAAAHGTAFCLGAFLNLTGERSCKEAINFYKDNFRPSPELSEPKWSVAVAGICAETEARAQELLAQHMSLGRYIKPTVVGDAEKCRDIVGHLSQEYHTDEIVFLDLCRKMDDRVLSYGLLAEAIIEKHVDKEQRVPLCAT